MAEDHAVASGVGRRRPSLRVGEARDTVAPHALRDLKQLSTGLRRWGSEGRTATRHQLLAGRLSRLERGRQRVDEDLDAGATDLRVREMRHAVRAHALGEGQPRPHSACPGRRGVRFPRTLPPGSHSRALRDPATSRASSERMLCRTLLPYTPRRLAGPVACWTSLYGLTSNTVITPLCRRYAPARPAT